MVLHLKLKDGHLLCCKSLFLRLPPISAVVATPFHIDGPKIYNKISPWEVHRGNGRFRIEGVLVSEAQFGGLAATSKKWYKMMIIMIS